MPLLDYFHPPLSENRHWKSFHTSWANEIMATLNQDTLPTVPLALREGPIVPVDLEGTYTRTRQRTVL